jgi:hypothetical protein
VKGENVRVFPCLKGRGSFIAVRQLNNYKHEMVGSLRSVGGFHGVRAYSVVFLAMRWMMLENVPGVTALWARLSLEAKLS